MNELDEIIIIKKNTCNKCKNEFNNENELKIKIENEDFNTLLFCPIQNCWYSFSDDYINKLEDQKLKDKYFNHKNRFNIQNNENISISSKNIFIVNDKEKRKKKKKLKLNQIIDIKLKKEKIIKI